MYIAKIFVTLRPTILDPQGKAVENSLRNIGFDSIEDTRIGKYIELTINASGIDEAQTTAQQACKKLLANPVMEDYKIEVVELTTERDG